MKPFSVDKPVELALQKRPLKKSSYERVIQTVENNSKVKKPALTMVVVAYNEGNELITALHKVFSQLTNKKYEVILVDNGLDAETVNKAKGLNLIYIKTVRNLGCTAGRNVGALFVNAPTMAFIDADGFIQKDFVENSLSAIQKFKTAVRGKVLPKTEGSITPFSYYPSDEQMPYYINAEGVSVWDVKTFKQAGGFEDSLYGGEGIVLQNRMIEIYGINPETFGYDPSLVLLHDYHADKQHFEEKQTRYEIITRKVHLRYPFLKSMITRYNDGAATDVKSETAKQTRMKSKIERVRDGVSRRFSEFYFRQYQARIRNPKLVTGSNDYQFSVVIPCYNVGSAIFDAVDSVLRQTIATVEVIVVDDVSTDPETKNALKELESKVRVIRRKKNGGVAAARNSGIKEASAAYVLCLDGDDTIEPEYLEQAYNVFESDPNIGLVSCWVQQVGARSGQWRPKDKTEIRDALLHSPLPTATCFRKEAWKKTNGYDENMRGYEDWNFWISVLSNNFTARVLPYTHFNYTISPTSKVHTSNKNAMDLVTKIFNNHRKLFEEHIEYVVTHIYRDYINLRTENLEMRDFLGQRNTILNLFRFDRYPNYFARAYKKGKSFFKIAWESKDPVYVAKLFMAKMKIYLKTVLRKLGMS